MNPLFDPPLPLGCPPERATSRSQDAFRIVKRNPPALEDFHSYAQLGLAPNVDQCRRLSFSIYESFRQANHRRNLTPRLGDYVAHAKLTEMHGVISLPNHQGHMEWWAFAGMVKPEEFKVVSGEHSA